jgi:uncharacterized membrane protein
MSFRGVITRLMALDHTRDFFGKTGFNPTDPTQTTIPLFFTRWITHFCAPVIFLLTGTAAYLSLGAKSPNASCHTFCSHEASGDLSGTNPVPLPWFPI